MSSSFRLGFKNLLPVPLRDRLSLRQSDIWQQTVAWNNQEQIFVQAPSGTGKTTFIHMLYGLRKGYEGEISWNEIPLRKTDTEALSSLRQKQLSVIFQDMRLFPSLTAMENLEIKRVLNQHVTVGLIQEWMDRLGIADRANRLAATLSYGEQQRVAIIRALLQPFGFLIMDEPFSHLDKANADLAAKLIEEVVQANGASILLVDLDDNSYFSYTQKLKL